MPNIPTIPGSARVDDQQIGVKRNVGPTLQRLGAFRGAVQAADSAIQGTLGVVAEYEEKKRKAEEAYVFNASSLSFQQLQSQYKSGIRKMPDEQIVPTWNQTAKDWKSQTLEQYGQKLSPVAKRQLQMNLDNAIGGATAGFQVDADHLGSMRREGAAVANYDKFLESGDPAMADQAKAAINLAVKNGDMNPARADYLIGKMPQVLQVHQVENAIKNNPYDVVKKLEDPDSFSEIKDDNVRLGLEGKANAAWDRHTKGVYDDIRKNQSNGTIYTRDQLNQMAAIGDIQGKSIDTILAAQAHEIKQEDIQVNTGKVYRMVTTLPTNLSANDRLRAVTTIHASPEYLSLPEPVKKDFDSALNAEKPNENPVENAIAKEAEKQFSNGLFRPYTTEDVTETEKRVWAFSDKKKVVGSRRVPPDVDPGWMQDSDEDTRNKTWTNYQQYKDQMKGFFKQNPEATFEDAGKFSQSLMTDHVSKNATQDLTPKPQFLKGQKVKQGGKTYTYDGTQFTEDK